GRLLLLAAAIMLVVAAVAHSALGILLPGEAVAFGGFIAFGELLRLAPPGAVVHGVATIPALQVVAVAAIGMTVGALPHVAAGRPAGITGMSTRLVAVACVAFIFRPLVASPALDLTAHLPVAIGLMAVLLLLGWLVD